MKHLLNIIKLNGAEVEPVDVIIGGSPCQDLSVAGKRAGLDGERSGLFMEQIRIIKEMRDADKLRHTNAVSTDCGKGGTTTIEGRIAQHGFCGANQHVRPRYMVWENVPGAFSSNKGEDFRVVLEETAKIADETAVIPRPDKGKWTNSGAIMGDGWSIAWRVFDAQFWGVPQRRRRIALVADFGGQSAPEILFERNGVSGDIAESGAEGEGVAGGVEAGVGEAIGLTNRGYCGGDTAETLRAQSHGAIPMVAGFCQGASPAAQTIGYQEEVSPTIKGAPSGTAQVPAVCYPINTQIIMRHNALGERTGFGLGEDGDPAYTIQAGHEHGVICLQGNGIDRADTAGCNGKGWREDVCYTLNTIDRPAVFDARGNGDGSIAPTMTGDHQNRVTDYTGIIAAVDCRNGTENPDINGTLQAKPNGGTSYNLQNTVRTHQSVRRLTPLECERLQGYEDNWTNIPPQTDVTEEDLTFWRTVWDEWQTMNGKKRHSDKQIIKWLQSEAADSARYKALGNSIALPPWRFVLSRIHNQGARTMASLFDGIGGFPKIWQELGGQTLWCSEVEPFPIAVTMYHFKEAHQ
jgi:DNA (cytosine-5)-methyltransferase 1